MTTVQQLAQVVSPWADFYNASPVAQSLVNFGHFGGMMTAGGMAVATDRATLKVPSGEHRTQLRHLRELAGAHPVVLWALVVTAISGLLLLAADVEALIVVPAFWIKMGLVALLLANGYQMVRLVWQLERTGSPDPKEWRRLRRASVLSLLLWFAVVLAGSILPNVS